MKIKTIGQLKEAIKTIDDDFTVDFVIYVDHMFNKIYSNLEFNDIGYSNKSVIFSTEIKSEDYDVEMTRCNK